MATDKNSFVLYADLIETVSKLPDNKAGKLFKTILEYVNDKNPKVEDVLVQVAFEPIRQQLKRDLKKWERKREQWSEAGKKSAEKRKAKNATESNGGQRNSTDVKSVATDSTVSVIDNVSVNVSVIENTGPPKINASSIVPSMHSVFKQHNPNGFFNQTEDFPVLKELAVKIKDWKSLKGDFTEAANSKQIQEVWTGLLTHIKSDQHLSKYSLVQINRHFQSIVQSYNSSAVKKEEPGFAKIEPQFIYKKL